MPHLLIVENRRRLLIDGDLDPDGRAVAIVSVVAARDWLPEDAAAACAAWEPGWLAWVLGDVRPVLAPFRVLAARKIYEVEVDAALLPLAPHDPLHPPAPARPDP